MLCWFCQERPGETREDAWPLWTETIWPTGPDIKWQQRLTRGGLEDAEVVREWTSNRPKTLVGGFCVPCNTQWMSRIENRAKDLLIPMIRGEPIDLAPPEQKTLARWAYLKTLVFSVTHPGVSIPSDEWHRFYKRRKPPHLARIAIAAADTPSPSGGLFRMDPMTLDYLDGGTAETYRGTFFVGHVFMQVFGPKPLGHRVVSDRPIRKINDVFWNIWPTGKHVISWMPPDRLNPAQVGAVLDFFYDPIPRR